jgi:hypothetical protein
MDPISIGGLIFALLLWRAIDRGEIDPDAILRCGCVAVLAIGAAALVGLALLGALAGSV